MSNDDDFVDIEDIQINNDTEKINQNEKKENNLNGNNNEIINENKNKVEEQIKEDIIQNDNIDKENVLNNDINNQEETKLQKETPKENQNIEKYNDISSIKTDQPIIKKKNTFNTFDNSIHIHNPVPLSKMQLAENKYYKIREELNKKYFATLDNSTEENQALDNTILESKKYKEMISYLEQLNDVLTEILKSSRIQQKEAEKIKKKSIQKSPEQIYLEQQKMNDNQEKMIEVYKKQLTSLQNRVNQVSKPNFLEELVEKNRKLDDEIEKLKTTNKKLNNEQKLNEIVISKQNKNEQEDKANMLLKRMNMDYDKIVRENEKLTKKIEEAKIKENDNENKIKQLQEFVDKLRTIAKDMYNITDYENVKLEEKNEKKKEEIKNQYKKRIEILKKKKESNIHKYQQEIAMNQKKINTLQKQLLEVEKELEIEQNNKNLRLGIPIPPPEKEENNSENNNQNNETNMNNEENIEKNNKEIKRCEDGSYDNIMQNEETTTNNNIINNIKEPNGKEIFDAKDLSNINPMNAMNEISVDVPFGENEEKKYKKPEFLDDNYEEKIQKNDKGENIEKNDEEKKSKEEKDEKEEKEKNEDKEEKNEKKIKEEEKIQILNNIINNEPKDEDIELEQLEEFQI